MGDDGSGETPATRIAPARKPFAGGRAGLLVSMALHMGAVGALVALGMTEAVTLPEASGHPPGIWLVPPPPPAPLPLGARESRSLDRAEPATHASNPRRDELVAPADLTFPDEVPLEAEPGLPEDLAEGSPNGSAFGIPEGMEDGVLGGEAGGLPGGVPGGMIGAEGTGPVSDADRPPRLLRQTLPVYPKSAFLSKLEGEVLLEVLIDTSGQVASARVIHSIPGLDAEALRTVREWRFEPARRRGHSVPVLARTKVRFRLL